MRVFFWLGLVIEGLLMIWYLYQAWLIYSGRSNYLPEAYPDMYKETLFPGFVLAFTFFGALLAQFYFRSHRVALYFVLSPLILFSSRSLQ